MGIWMWCGCLTLLVRSLFRARLLFRIGSGSTWARRGPTMTPAIQKPTEHHCQRNDHDAEQLVPNTRHSRPLLFHMQPNPS